MMMDYESLLRRYVMHVVRTGGRQEAPLGPEFSDAEREHLEGLVETFSSKPFRLQAYLEGQRRQAERVALGY